MGYVENQNRNRAQARANFQERYNPLDGVVEAIARIDRESREAAAKEAERIAAKERDAKTDARNAATDARAVTAAGEVSAQRKFEMDQAKAKVNREQDERAAGQFLDEVQASPAPVERPDVTLDADGNEVMEITAEELADDMPDGDVDIALKATRGARMREGGVSMAGRGSGSVEDFASDVRRIEGEREQAAADRAAKKEKEAADLALVQARIERASRVPQKSSGTSKTAEEIAAKADKEADDTTERKLRISKLEKDLDVNRTSAALERKAKFAAAAKDIKGLRASISKVIKTGLPPGPLTGRIRSMKSSLGDEEQVEFEAYASSVNTQLFGFLRTDAPSAIENVPMDKLRILISDTPENLEAKLNVIESLIAARMAQVEAESKDESKSDPSAKDATEDELNATAEQ